MEKKSSPGPPEMAITFEYRELAAGSLYAPAYQPGHFNNPHDKCRSLADDNSLKVSGDVTIATHFLFSTFSDSYQAESSLEK